MGERGKVQFIALALCPFSSLDYFLGPYVEIGTSYRTLV